MKIAVVYWSGTGNTEAMAGAVCDGAKNAGAEAALFPCGEFDEGKADGFDALAFGCPAMGAESLEEGEFEPVFAACEPVLGKKRVALFGSYGWGGGEWMRSWEERCAAAGITLAAESVIARDAPDDEALEQCRRLGAALGA